MADEHQVDDWGCVTPSRPGGLPRLSVEYQTVFLYCNIEPCYVPSLAALEVPLGAVSIEVAQ